MRATCHEPVKGDTVGHRDGNRGVRGKGLAVLTPSTPSPAGHLSVLPKCAGVVGPGGHAREWAEAGTCHRPGGNLADCTWRIAGSELNRFPVPSTLEVTRSHAGQRDQRLPDVRADIPQAGTPAGEFRDCL